jgi:hypothetical protein
MRTRASKRYCSDRCRYRAYYAANRDRKLRQDAERRARHSEQRFCSCGKPTHIQRSPYCAECSKAAVERRSFRERERSRRYYAANRKRRLRQFAQYRAEHFEQRYCRCGKPTHSQKSPYCKSCSEAAATRRRFRKRVA